MTIRVSTAGGANIEFPDGTDAATIGDVMGQMHGRPPAGEQPTNRMAFAPSNLADSAPPMTTGDKLMDAVKSFGSGLARGVVSLSTMPGNIEQIGRMGINKAFDVGTKLALGSNANVPAPVSNDTVFPTQNDVIAKDEAKFGKWYEPQTVPGQYARTAGEFAPAALAGGPEVGLATRAANVLGPAVASETAGQVAQKVAPGLEPYARAAFSMVGGPKLPQGVMRTASPLASDATRMEHVANLQNQGITALSAGERTGNNGLRYMESEAGNTLFGGGTARAMEKLKGEQATEAAWRHVGIPAKDILPETITGAQETLGNGFEGLAKMTKFRVDPTLTKELTHIGDEYDTITSPFNRSGMPQKIISDITNMGVHNPEMTGALYQSIRSSIGKKMKQARDNSDGYLANTLGDLQDALDGAMERGAGQKMAGAWNAQRARWRDFLAIQDAAGRAGENTANGILSMPALRSALSKQEGSNFAKSQRPIVKLARSAEGVMKAMPNSGTNARGGLRRLSAGGAMVGMAAGAPFGQAGIVGGGAAGMMAPLALEGAAAKAITSGPVQGFLGNQLMAKPLGALNAGQLPAWLRPYLGLVGAQGAEAEAPASAKGKR